LYDSSVNFGRTEKRTDSALQTTKRHIHEFKVQLFLSFLLLLLEGEGAEKWLVLLLSSEVREEIK
jgi:hypothetical protein